ncbi:MAG TPA: hypothetical protein DCS63_05210 [Elusimicrobia bacterium]|nr:hypothetical protein [Elusimicrobiota bacterium]
MGTIFSNALTKYRKEAGFKTAYQFFHCNGAKPFFKISYRMYLLIEQGKLLPPFRNVGTYMHALRLFPQSYDGIVFVTAWLETTVGEDAFTELLAPLITLPKEKSISSSLHKAVAKLLTEKKFYMTRAQVTVVTRNKGAYLCWAALNNDTGNWTIKTLAAAIGLSLPEAKRIILEFAGVKLIKRQKDGTYKCPMAGAIVEYPRMDILHSDMQKKILDYQSELASSGRPTYLRLGILRASLLELANCYPLLSLNVSTAATYAITEKRKDSALFTVECKVTKIRDF